MLTSQSVLGRTFKSRCAEDAKDGAADAEAKPATAALQDRRLGWTVVTVAYAFKPPSLEQATPR
jgi:hypothetical protein